MLNFMYNLLKLLDAGKYQQAADEIHAFLHYSGFFTPEVIVGKSQIKPDNTKTDPTQGGSDGR